MCVGDCLAERKPQVGQRLSPKYMLISLKYTTDHYYHAAILIHFIAAVQWLMAVQAGQSNVMHLSTRIIVEL